MKRVNLVGGQWELITTIGSGPETPNHTTYCADSDPAILIVL